MTPELPRRAAAARIKLRGCDPGSHEFGGSGKLKVEHTWGVGRCLLKAAGSRGFFVLAEGFCYVTPRRDHGLRKELDLSADIKGIGGMYLPSETPICDEETWGVRQQKVPKIAC